MRVRPMTICRGIAVILLVLPARVDAQHAHPPAEPGASETRAVEMQVGAHAVPLLTRVDPILLGEAKTEAYVTQPTLFGSAAALNGALRLDAAISLEGLTIDDGELAAGAYGEGFVDKRHPHTYLHELMLTGRARLFGTEASVAAGRGFAPFGTDDPMMRPFVKFPVNHHLGQILERLVLIGGVRRGPLMLEAALFSGDEPGSTTDVGTLDRFGDSWAARMTVMPLRGLEIQASRAFVESPEFPLGGGWDQRKWSASARMERTLGSTGVYALGEWKRTDQVDRGRDVFSFGSLLLEGGVDLRGWRPAVRFERTERPEEERLADPFRTHWPHAGGHVLGITRWNIAGARVERGLRFGSFAMAPFVEVSYAHIRNAVQGPFDATELYGSDNITTFNVGARLNAGMHPPRMGRYGVAAAKSDHAH